jgi:nitroreductase / dihydropteridine reductase
MDYIKNRILDEEETKAVSISPAEINVKQVHSIISRAQRLSSSYGLHPFSVIPLAPDVRNIAEKTIRKWQAAKNVPGHAYLLVLAIRSVFNRESVESFVSDTGINSNISRNYLSAYLGNIKNSIHGKDVDGRRWAAKQADLALQIIISAAREVHLTAEVLKNDSVSIFDSSLSLKEKGLHTYAIVTIV